MEHQFANLAAMPKKELIVRGEVLLWGSHDLFLVMRETGPIAGLRKLLDKSLHIKEARESVIAAAGDDVDVQLAIARIAEPETMQRAEVMYETTMERMLIFCTAHRHLPDCQEFLEQAFRANFSLASLYTAAMLTDLDPALDRYNMSLKFRNGRFRSNMDFLKNYVNVDKILNP
jgi:hypothetical protein